MDFSIGDVKVRPQWENHVKASEFVLIHCPQCHCAFACESELLLTKAGWLRCEICECVFDGYNAIESPLVVGSLSPSSKPEAMTNPTDEKLALDPLVAQTLQDALSTLPSSSLHIVNPNEHAIPSVLMDEHQSSVPEPDSHSQKESQKLDNGLPLWDQDVGLDQQEEQLQLSAEIADALKHSLLSAGWRDPSLLSQENLSVVVNLKDHPDPSESLAVSEVHPESLEIFDEKNLEAFDDGIGRILDQDHQEKTESESSLMPTKSDESFLASIDSDSFKPHATDRILVDGTLGLTPLNSAHQDPLLILEPGSSKGDLSDAVLALENQASQSLEFQPESFIESTEFHGVREDSVGVKQAEPLNSENDLLNENASKAQFSFMRQRKTKGWWIVGNTMLLVALCAQVGIWQKEKLVASWPVLGAVAGDLCQRLANLNCEVPLLKDEQAIHLQSADLKEHTDEKNMSLYMVISNLEEKRLLAPAIQLEILDQDGKITARKILKAKEWLGREYLDPKEEIASTVKFSGILGEANRYKTVLIWN